jgi:hypothetical protein
MPPEPQAGSSSRPAKGSTISVIGTTSADGVKNSPPFWPSLRTYSPRKYSSMRPTASNSRSVGISEMRLSSAASSGGYKHW